MSDPRKIAAIGVIALVMIALIILAVVRFGFVAGDPNAVYFPIVQNVIAGQGIAGWAPLWEGAGRMPGYIIALVPFAVVFGDLMIACKALGLTSALIVLVVVASVLRRANAPMIACIGTPILIAFAPSFVRLTTEPLPDLVFLAIFAVIVEIVLRESMAVDRRRRLLLALAAGALGGAAALVRLNGLGLALGIPVAMLVCDRRDWKLRPLIAIAGFAAIFFSVMIVLSRGLDAFDVIYPRGNQELLFVPKAGQSALDALIEPYRIGLDQLWVRLAEMVSVPSAALGISAILYATFKAKIVEAKVAFWLTGSVLGMLIPLHFEPRYWLPVVPGLVVGFLWGGCALGDRIGLERRTTSTLLIAILLFLGIGRASNSIDEVRESSALSWEIFGVCRLLEQDAPKEGRVLIGIWGDNYAYSVFRECPRPTKSHPRFTLVAASSDAVGLDYWLQYETEPAVASVEEVGRAAGWVLHRMAEPESPPVEGTTLREGLVVNLPRNAKKPCLAHALVLAPGENTLGFEVTAPTPLSARLVLRTDSGEWTVHATGDRVKRRATVLTDDGQLDLFVCAADAIRSKGRITVDRIWSIDPGG